MERLPTADGREVLIRPCFKGEALQIAIVGKRGGLVEAVTFDATQLDALIGALKAVGAQTERDLMAALAQAKKDAKASHKAALAANKWLNGEMEAEARARYER